MIIAYIFWMRTTKSFSYENILTVAVERQIDRHLDEVNGFRSGLEIRLQRLTQRCFTDD